MGGLETGDGNSDSVGDGEFRCLGRPGSEVPTQRVETGPIPVAGKWSTQVDVGGSTVSIER